MWPPTRRESPDAMQVNGPSSLPVSSSWVERAKVHRAFFEFINWVARMGAKKLVSSKIKSLPVRLLQELLEAQGRPKPERQSLDDNTLCSRVYETQKPMRSTTKTDRPHPTVRVTAILAIPLGPSDLPTPRNNAAIQQLKTGTNTLPLCWQPGRPMKIPPVFQFLDATYHRYFIQSWGVMGSMMFLYKPSSKFFCSWSRIISDDGRGTWDGFWRWNWNPFFH